MFIYKSYILLVYNNITMYGAKNIIIKFDTGCSSSFFLSIQFHFSFLLIFVFPNLLLYGAVPLHSILLLSA